MKKFAILLLALLLALPLTGCQGGLTTRLRVFVFIILTFPPLK